MRFIDYSDYICYCVQDAFLRMCNGVCYQLVGAVIYYRCGKESGHYISYFKDHTQKQWFLANDSRVRDTFGCLYHFDTCMYMHKHR